MKKLLIIGRTFPEPNTTAAGTRMMQLIQLFQEQNYDITFATTAAESPYSVDLKALQIDTQAIAINDDSFDAFIRDLAPGVVLFDRYISEEHFGWRVATYAPQALRILDTEDLHFLREAREKAFKHKEEFYADKLYTELAQREIASILRCDLSIIISEVEMAILQESFSVNESLLVYLPFLIDKEAILPLEKLPSFAERNHFVTIGNFYHKPNVDAVLFLKQEIWPLIKAHLPKAELHIYGAYAKQQVQELHNVKDGFLIKGWAEDVHDVMQQAKVCIAPIRFGAGLKGKLLDALWNGTPVISTPIGIEGMYGNFDVPGKVGSTAEELAKEACSVYSNEKKWQETLKNRDAILLKRFEKQKFITAFLAKLKKIEKNLRIHRDSNFIGQILQSEQYNSIRFKSKWIAEKNKY